ncbi:acyltransferase family protein [Janibacter anophelis]|uniref:acyltransferase family protein n=1 Tax=Janibacter anophelis TaxID=319054 RepID=UPI000DEFA70E|nr:acyltransferase [Janibacter anophelis]
MGRESGHIIGIDALRMLAALAVFLCHLVGYWHLTDLPLRLPELLAIGAHGVDLFIVLSGFVLALPAFLSGRPLETKGFLARRATRLVPPYVVALAVAAAIAFSPAATMIVAKPAQPSDLAWHLLMLQTWNPPTLGTINGSLWSVALEAQLYLLFPLLLIVARRWGATALLLGTGGMSILLTTVGPTGPVGVALTDEHNLPVRMVQFAAGIACARLVALDLVPRRSALTTILVASGLLAVGWSTADIHAAKIVVWTIPCAAAVLLVVSSIGGRLAATPFERWGLASYSFYLLHQPIVLIVGALAGPHVDRGFGALAVGLAVALPATALASLALYVAVERRAHRYGKAHFRMFRAAPESASTPSPSPM